MTTIIRGAKTSGKWRIPRGTAVKSPRWSSLTLSSLHASVSRAERHPPGSCNSSDVRQFRSVRTTGKEICQETFHDCLKVLSGLTTLSAKPADLEPVAELSR